MEHIYITSMGAVWRLTRHKYIKMLAVMAANQPVDYNDFGKMVTDNLRHVTDWTAENAQDELNNEK